MNQRLIINNKIYEELINWVEESHAKSILLVCGSSLRYQKTLISCFDRIEKAGIEIVRFSEFNPNPTYESVEIGVNCFLDNNCDAIIAVGGGSAMDVAKCIKLFSNMDHDENYLQQEIKINSIPFMAIPTTAGTGSEATRYAVIYYKGVKQSVTHESCIPDSVILNASLLYSLPLYQKKATMMDALSHAIESFWSVNSTEESRAYSKNAIELIVNNIDGYLNNTEIGNKQMLIASNIAGKAINITQTTAGHAMCYKITSLFGISHGHSAILCNRILYKWMVNNTKKCIDQRGEEHLKAILDDIGVALGASNSYTGAERLIELFQSLELDVPKASEKQFDELIDCVNLERLKNFPIELDKKTIRLLYNEILR